MSRLRSHLPAIGVAIAAAGIAIAYASVTSRLGGRLALPADDAYRHLSCAAQRAELCAGSPSVTWPALLALPAALLRDHALVVTTFAIAAALYAATVAGCHRLARRIAGELGGVLAAVAILLPSSSARLSPAVRPLPHRAERIVYGITTIVLGIAAYVAFLRWLRFPSQPWYYLPVMGVTATALDAVCIDLRARAMRLGVASAAWAAAAVSLATGDLRSRNSTADVAAGYVRKSAVSGDFVVVSPWYLGVSFARYYDGDAEWETAPPLSDHRIHRFDLVARHKSSRGVAPLRDHVMATLAAGALCVVRGNPVAIN